MKKIIYCSIILTLSISGAFAQQMLKVHTAKLSPLTQLYLFEVKKNTGIKYLPDYVYKTGNDQKTYISGLIKVNPTIQQNTLTNLGIHTGTKAGNIWTVQIPVENVEAFTTTPGIDYIQLDEPVIRNLDSARVATRVDSVQKGYGLPMPYSGENVVVGDVDGGFDYGHPELFDTTGSLYRVKRVWEQSTLGTAPDGYAYGNEMTDSTDMWAKGTDGAGSHGTHVTGICAGSGLGSNKNRQYRGMAYKADIVMVGIAPDSTQWVTTGVSDIIDGVNYVYQYAASVQKPAVVNLSWGSPCGPRDGTSLFGSALDNLTGPGKIFVCSAGNNGTDSIHLEKTFSTTDTLLQTFINITNAPGGKRTWVDIWGDSSKTFCTAVSLYSTLTGSNTTGFICLDNNIHHTFLVGSNNDTCFIDMVMSTSEFNNRPRVFLNFYSRVTDSVLISIKSTGGRISMWDSYVYSDGGFYSPFKSFGFPWATAGDNHVTISDIASTKSAITVGAFNTKINWRGANGLTYSYSAYAKKGYLAFFSSLGPNSDGSMKPDISAPGLTVTSGGSSYDPGLSSTGGEYGDVISHYTFSRMNRTYPFVTFIGTSMAAPVVSGIAALLLQVKPDLTPGGLKDILFATAIHDKYTGTLPAEGVPDWGHGKVNAYGAIKELLKEVGIKSIVTGTLNCDAFPNPNNGNFTINYSANNGGIVNLTVYDLLGHIAALDKWTVTPGDNSRQFSFTALSKGVYFVGLSAPEGYSAIKIVIE